MVSVGLLDLRRISWQHSSGDLLQKVMQCDAGRFWVDHAA